MVVVVVLPGEFGERGWIPRRWNFIQREVGSEGEGARSLRVRVGIWKGVLRGVVWVMLGPERSWGRTKLAGTVCQFRGGTVMMGGNDSPAGHVADHLVVLLNLHRSDGESPAIAQALDVQA